MPNGGTEQAATTPLSCPCKAPQFCVQAGWLAGKRKCHGPGTVGSFHSSPPERKRSGSIPGLGSDVASPAACSADQPPSARGRGKTAGSPASPKDGQRSPVGNVTEQKLPHGSGERELWGGGREEEAHHRLSCTAMIGDNCVDKGKNPPPQKTAPQRCQLCECKASLVLFCCEHQLGNAEMTFFSAQTVSEGRFTHSRGTKDSSSRRLNQPNQEKLALLQFVHLCIPFLCLCSLNPRLKLGQPS